MVFKSAVDWWYYLVVVVVTIVTLFVILPPLASGQLSIPLGVAIIILSVGLPVWLLLSTSYRVETDSMLINSGPFSWTIPLAEIQSIEPSRSPLSSPALSLDRLEIQYGSGKSVLVSPVDREAFLDAVGINKSAK